MMEHPAAKFTPDRRKALLARLKEGYGFDQVAQAIVGLTQSAHHRGENDRHTVYDDLTLICRSGSKLEGFMEKTNAETTRRSVERWQAAEGRVLDGRPGPGGTAPDLPAPGLRREAVSHPSEGSDDEGV
jgi:hypothetical protein